MSSQPKTLKQKISEAPTYMKALPVIGLGAGMAYGKIVKKCWGCAFGFGAAGFAVGCIPLAIHLNKLDAVEIAKPTDAKDEKKKEEGATTKEPSATVKDILAVMETSASNKEQSEKFKSQKEKITQALGSLTEKEQQGLLEFMQLGQSLESKKMPPQQMMVVLGNKMGGFEKKYGKGFMQGLQTKMNKLQQDFQISPIA